MPTNHRGQFISHPYLNARAQKFGAGYDPRFDEDVWDKAETDKCTCSGNGECSNCQKAMDEAGEAY